MVAQCFPCYSAKQDSTPLLSNNDCPCHSPTTNSRPQRTATSLVHHWPCSTLNRTTLASTSDCVLDLQSKELVTQEMVSNVCLFFSNTANNHMQPQKRRQQVYIVGHTAQYITLHLDLKAISLCAALNI
jgi:hypothetical protein